MDKKKGSGSSTSMGSTQYAPLAKPPSGSIVIDFAADAARFVPKEADCQPQWAGTGSRPGDRHIYI